MRREQGDGERGWPSRALAALRRFSLMVGAIAVLFMMFALFLKLAPNLVPGVPDRNLVVNSFLTASLVVITYGYMLETIDMRRAMVEQTQLLGGELRLLERQLDYNRPKLVFRVVDTKFPRTTTIFEQGAPKMGPEFVSIEVSNVGQAAALEVEIAVDWKRQPLATDADEDLELVPRARPILPVLMPGEQLEFRSPLGWRRASYQTFAMLAEVAGTYVDIAGMKYAIDEQVQLSDYFCAVDVADGEDA